MTQDISERLKMLRTSRGFSQATLAKKARLNKQTIYRLEKGRQPARAKNVDRLAQVLEVDLEVLTGKAPIPSGVGGPSEVADQVQLNVRIDEDIRNAFELAARRYGMSVRRIVELAPLLFVLAAEGSLKRRRDRLTALEAMFGSASDLRKHSPHLPSQMIEGFELNLVEDETRSIANRDLFGSEISGDLFYDHEIANYDEESNNPLVCYLRELASDYSDVEISAVGPTYTDYEVCRSDAIELAGGDEQLAEGLIRGWVLINEMPREPSERVEWLRSKIKEVLARRVNAKADPAELAL